MKKFITISVLLVVSRFFDAFTTYKFIPDLQGEKNPLVSVLRLGWTGVLLVQIVVLSLLIYAVYVYCFKTIKTIKFDNSVALKEFVSIFHFGNPKDFFKLLYKLPTNKYSLIYALGAIVSKVLIIFSLLVGCSTTMLIFSDRYRFIYREFEIPNFLYLFNVLVGIFLTINFYKKEKNKRVNSFSNV